MALAEIGNLATALVNQLLGQDQNASNTAPAASAPPTNANALPQDHFTPSAQQNSPQNAAQQAGLFQIVQFSALSVAVDITQTRAAVPQPAQNPPPLPVQQVTAPAPPQVTPQAAAPATPATTALSVQDQLQTLNVALAALGLSNSDIQSLDRIASVVRDFNPVAYRNLVFQLQELARQTAPPAAANGAPKVPSP